MLPQMPFCSPSKPSSSFRPFERTGAAVIVSELDAVPPAKPDDERNIFVVLSARAIGSVGFGLSVLAIWLRWLSPVVVVTDAPSEVARINGRRRRSYKPVAPNVNSRQALSHPKLVHFERPSSLSKRVCRDRPHRVCFADLPCLESEEARSQSVTRPTSDIQLPHSHLPSTPTRPSSRPSTIALTPSLVLEDKAGLESETPRPSNSTAYILPKTRTPSQAKSKRFSLPSTLLESSSGPLVAMTTAATTEVPRNKLARPFTQSWRHSRSKSTISSDTEINTFDAVVLDTSRPAFSRSSSPGFRSSSPSNISRRSLSSALFARRTSTRSNNPPLPRTSPYEAPYFACPPIPVDNPRLRSRSTRRSLDYAHPAPSGSMDIHKAGRDRRESTPE